MWSLQELQNQIASEIDQSDTAPTAGSTDWNIRLNLLNRALKDWAESYEWRALLKIHNGIVSTSTGNASYALPSDFKKISSLPKIVSDGITTYEFPVVTPDKDRRYTEGTDKWVNILENGTTKIMYVHVGTLASGASIQFSYWSHAATLATTSQISECPDPSYLVQRTLYYLYKGREDGRFPESKVEADRILARMIENENTLGRANVDRRVSVGDESYHDWRIGRD